MRTTQDAAAASAAGAPLRTVLHTDVLVVGGGTAGCLAALAAADEGASVVVLEQDTSLGGTGTRGAIHSYWYGSPGGFQDTIDRLGWARAKEFGGRPRGFHPEAKRTVLAELMATRSVEVRFGATVYDVLTLGRTVVAVLAATAHGTLEVRARVTIDASGDGDVAATAGVPFRGGRVEDGVYQPYSLVPRLIVDENQLSYRNVDNGWVDPTDPWDVTRALLDGRRRLRLLAEDAAEQPYLNVAPLLGVREGRHIDGEYALRLEDVIDDRRFPDVVFRGFSHYDNHAVDFANENDLPQIWTVVLGLQHQGLNFEVPYRCLVPQEVDGLLVACRALSLERDAAMPVRMQREMQKAGEAAGVAAALCALNQTTPRALEVRRLQERLVERGLLTRQDLERASAPPIHFTAGPLAGLKRSFAEAEDLDALLDYLGTDEEGKALFWLWQQGEAAAARLRHIVVTDDEYRRRRGAAFGLALLGDRAAVPQLLETAARRDLDVPEAAKKRFPRWLAALTMLRLLDEIGALDDVLAALDEPHPPFAYTFLLRYVHHFAASMEETRRRPLSDRLHCWPQRPGLGDDYALAGGRSESIRWRLALRVAAILAELGDARARAMCTEYAADERAYVRTAARATAAAVDAALAGMDHRGARGAPQLAGMATA